ncbi:hypothetical protein CLV30_110133 [Haloactinopolyspora alba]|uniref:Copper(I)-binding protein n=1 Tax=Haloactinopolyspora alba TaxID=648780 RepID=A0A2P8DZ38_9ACTN|nr:hypothetical protein [Haloactinopolyspora alba]PSL02480.1 hypothetical protein CLV30_110133 [Haloactinopolyspora alba]
MKSAALRRALVAVPLIALSVAGCSIHEQTQGWYAPANGVNADAGQVGLRNVLVVAGSGGRATVLAALSNEGTTADALVGVSVGDTQAELEGGAIEIPSNGHATVGPSAHRADVQSVDAVPGRMIEVEFRFERAPRVTVDALVETAEGMYADALPGGSTPTGVEDGEMAGTEEPTAEPNEDEPADDEPIGEAPG